MRRFKKSFFAIAIYATLLSGCKETATVTTTNKNLPEVTESQFTQLSEAEYPDNPENGYLHSAYNSTSYKSITIEPFGDKFNITIKPQDQGTNNVVYLNNVNLDEFIPTSPEWLRSDSYLSDMNFICQEWNRNSVDFSPNFHVNFNGTEKYRISKVTLANNCLNSYLWELMLFAKENGKDKRIFHGWFNFPKETYKYLFEKVNKLNYDNYKASMENWTGFNSKFFNTNSLRTVTQETKADFTTKNDQLYPVVGERLKKQKLILVPTNATDISSFQSDDTKFAMFVPPGLYKKSVERATQLGRFANVHKIMVRSTMSKNKTADKCLELEMFFSDKSNSRDIRFIIGGIDLNRIPTKTEANCNEGWNSSLGVANHPFSQSFDSQQKYKVGNNPYFAALVDKDGNILDNHSIGVDGPLLHRDVNNPNLLHVWLLSFERIALVGHYVVDISSYNK